MSEALPIPLWAMGVCFALLAIPLFIAWYFRLGLLKRILVATTRMTVQLVVVGAVLIFLFERDNSWLNMGWVVLAICFATYSAIQSSDLVLGPFLLPVFVSLSLASLPPLLLFTGLLVDLENMFTAQYLIILGGMLLGNALRGVVIGISDFFQALRQQRDRHRFLLGSGASRFESIRPFLRQSLQAALNPSLAAMATIGVVFLPGMMTGQIIGGSSPDTAIRYQIAIMIFIFVCISLSVLMAILFSLRVSLDDFGNLREDIFRA